MMRLCHFYVSNQRVEITWGPSDFFLPVAIALLGATLQDAQDNPLHYLDHYPNESFPL